MTLLNDDYRHQGMRKHLVQTIKQGPGKVSDEAVLRAMGAVPRHLFIDDSAFLSLAYADQAFP
ncbi:MAG TPA: protein-L-isoaspartate O-methyltransferase, partial [Flavobacteriales bacterium]|nr:protein-L-isoaspartate O-methyltransferase [Flavobacteriales bacterium]